MHTFPSRGHREPFDAAHLNWTLAIAVAALCALVLFLSAVDSGLTRVEPAASTPVANAADNSTASGTVEFDYFPSHYTNQAKEISAPIDQF